MAIITPAEQWAYAVTVPLNRSELERHDRFCIKISILVHVGCVGIGILQRDENSFLQEVPVAGSSSWREVVLGIPSLDTAGPLVIRNHSACGPSQCNCGSSISSALRTKSTDKSSWTISIGQ
jgi:hypothetical protein